MVNNSVINNGNFLNRGSEDYKGLVGPKILKGRLHGLDESINRHF